MRGFHLAASLSHLLTMSVDAEYWAIHDDGGDILPELTLLRQDAGQSIPRWQPSIRHLRFDLYVVMADVVPVGTTFRAARSCARRTVLGLMFPPEMPTDKGNLRFMEGHDTRAFAQQLGSALQGRWLMFPGLMLA